VAVGAAGGHHGPGDALPAAGLDAGPWGDLGRARGAEAHPRHTAGQGQRGQQRHPDAGMVWTQVRQERASAAREIAVLGGSGRRQMAAT
jgi:hypothetical protein